MGRNVCVDLGTIPGLTESFHKMKDSAGASTKELLLQMIEHCLGFKPFREEDES